MINFEKKLQKFQDQIEKIKTTTIQLPGSLSYLSGLLHAEYPQYEVLQQNLQSHLSQIQAHQSQMSSESLQLSLQTALLEEEVKALETQRREHERAELKAQIKEIKQNLRNVPKDLKNEQDEPFIKAWQVMYSRIEEWTQEDPCVLNKDQDQDLAETKIQEFNSLLEQQTQNIQFQLMKTPSLLLYTDNEEQIHNDLIKDFKNQISQQKMKQNELKRELASEIQNFNDNFQRLNNEYNEFTKAFQKATSQLQSAQKP